MFRKPTLRSQRNPKPTMFFHDSLPMNAGRLSRDAEEIHHHVFRANPADNEHQVADAATGVEAPFTAPTPIGAGYTPKAVPSARPDGSVSSTTEGGTGPKSLHYDLVEQFELQGNQVTYWPTSSPTAYHVFKSRTDVVDNVPTLVATYPHDTKSYLATDKTTTHFRIWRASQQSNDMGRPGIARGQSAANIVKDRATAIRSINQANATKWGK